MFTKPIAIVDDEVNIVNIVNIYSEVLQMSGYKVHSFISSFGICSYQEKSR